MPEFNNNMQQAVMEQAAPQFSEQTEWGELDPETEEIVYSGETTMTQFYKKDLPKIFTAMALVEVMVVVNLFVVKSLPPKMLAFILVHIWMGAIGAREFWQCHRSKQVVLRHVQKVVPVRGDMKRPGKVNMYRVHFPVVVDGQQQEGKTEFIFTEGSESLQLAKYVGIPRNAGYDEEKGYWVII